MSRNRDGFTIIELLIVVLIIGILTGIALPKFGSTRDKATLAAVRSDVRNAETAEEAFYADNGRYATFAQLQAATNYSVSPGTVMTITPSTSPGSVGYKVNASNASIATSVNSCKVQVGMGATVSVDGVISCP